MSADDPFAYLGELISLYLRVSSLLSGFRLPLSNPFTIDGDNNGRATAIILMLGREGSIRMSDIAERLKFSPSSATMIVDKMVKQGLVKRIQQADDRRIVRIGLDDEGRAVFKKLHGEIVGSIERILTPLTQEEKAEFTRLFRKIAYGTQDRN
ncbi:MAG: MarR family transcriptional regulator [Candidatus Lokiarchaeota archaeon]|nr:MarR family transcriptional regulator [Candidatus Lokiarchaeota archaeon]